VDTSLLEAGITTTYWQSAICLATGISPGAIGSAHPLNAPYQALPTADGWINIGAANQANWLRLVEALEAPELAADPRFADNAARMKNLDALTGLLTPRFRARPTAAWLTRLEAAGVPAGPVLTIGEMLADPQVRAREMVIETIHSRLGPVKTLGPPVKLSATAPSVRRAAPLLGEHTREILREHGYSDGDIERLAASGDILLAR
jgi:crotonobetainyl-CoA:carnitine CoA-transferase CaiB-like acyl-CoA transferase